MQAHFSEPSPRGEGGAGAAGHGEDHLRLPMVPVTAATRQKLEKLLGELGLLAHAASNS